MGARHAGSVSKKGRDGRWRGRVTIAGQLYTVSSTVSKTDCRRLLRARIAEATDASARPAPAAGPLTVDGYCDRWLRDKALTLGSPATLAKYTRVLGRWVRPRLGAIPVAALGAEAIRALYAELAAAGASRATVAEVHRILRAMLGDAIRDPSVGLDAGCVVGVRRPSAPKPDRPHPDAEVLRRLLACTIARVEPDRFADGQGLGTQWPVMLALELVTGLRLGELCGLLWDDVDLGGATITLVRQLGHDDLVLRDLKARAQRREVALPASVARELAAHRDRQDAHRRGRGAWVDRDGLVFTSDTGRHLHHEVVRRAYKRLLARADVDDMTFHALRHGHGEAARRVHADLMTLKDRLGHAKLATTAEFYLHRSSPLDRELAENVDGLLRRVG